MKQLKYVMFTLMITVLSLQVMAQQRGNRGFDPSVRIAKEKEAVLAKVTDLNEDQKAILDEIYTEYETAIKDLISEHKGDREAMRTGLIEIKDEKEKAVAELLSEAQLEKYKEAIEENRPLRRRPN